MALMVYRTASQVELPPTVRSRMLLNITIDFLVGLVPFIGDVADALYKCNTRNAALLYTHLQAVGQERLKKQKEKPGRQGAERQEHHRAQQSQPFEPAYPEPSHGPTSQNTRASAIQGDAIHSQPTTTQPSSNQQPGGSKGGWFTRFTNTRDGNHNSVERDLENGE